MTTINDVTFNMKTLEIVNTHRNIPNEEIGTDESFITDMGYTGLVLRMTGYEKTLAKYDEVINEFMKSGAHTLVHRTGWQFTIYSTQLVPFLDIGIVDNFFPYEMTMLTSNPYRESTSETTRSKTITTNNQEWTQDDSTNDIDTDGIVDAIPDIKLIGGAADSSETTTSVSQLDSDSNYNMNNSGSTVIITQSAYDGTQNIWVTQEIGQTINCRKAGMAVIDSIQVDVSSILVTGNVTCTVYDKVSGASLGSKTLNITSTGLKTFTFTTPIAVVQDENTCSDSTDANKIFFEFAADGGIADIYIRANYSSVYADGMVYDDQSPEAAEDLKFVITGHSCKEIRQTFEFDNIYLASVHLNLCKYQYAGTNPVTVVIKEGATTLGTGTAVLTGSTFSIVEFALSEETTRSLILAPSTTYTMVITPPSDSGNATAVLIKTDTTAGYADGAVTLVEDGDTTRAQTHDLYFKLDYASLLRDRVPHEDLDATEYDGNTTGYVLKKTFTYAANADRVHHLSRVGCEGKYVNANLGHCQVRYSIGGAADVTIDTYTCDSTSYETFSTATDITTAPNESLEVKYYVKNNVGGETTRIKNTASDGKELALQVCKNPQVYNVADTTVKSSAANEIDPDMIFLINVDGTGTIDYNDDFSTDKYLNAYWSMIGVTHDTGNDELDLADDGHLAYSMDTKHPVTGIPTLTSRINITAGTPTIQISSNGTTWYDITTAIVDDVETVYALDSSSLSLKGLTTFYWRFDCAKAAAATCSIKNFELDVVLTTIDVEHPKITANGVSTVRCDQHADSGMNCVVALIYRDRSWPV